MPESTDAVIRDAFAAIAASAVAPERVRARIDARARVHRQRRMLLAGAGLATVAAAVSVPLALRSGAPEAAGPPPAPEDAIGLLYTPGWLPAGVGEQRRSVKFDTRTGQALGGSRSWYPDGLPPSDAVPPGSVTFMIDEWFDPETSEPVMIGDVRGRTWVTDAAWVQWQPAGGPRMAVSAFGTGNDAEIALRVARSVVPTTETMPVTLWWTRVTDDFAGTGWFAASPDGGGQQSIGYDSDTKRNALFSVQTARPEPDIPFASAKRDGIRIYLPFEGDVGLTRDMAEVVLGQMRCLPPDLSWVGGR
jgi:hypothetical protein